MDACKGQNLDSATDYMTVRKGADIDSATDYMEMCKGVDLDSGSRAGMAAQDAAGQEYSRSTDGADAAG